MIYYSDMDKDIKEITDTMSELGYYFDSPKEVATLWKEFSEEFFAQWFVVNIDSIRYFIEWFKNNKEVEKI